jgi:hypothetical protein
MYSGKIAVPPGGGGIVVLLYYYTSLIRRFIITWVYLKPDKRSEKCFNGMNVIIRLIKRV